MDRDDYDAIRKKNIMKRDIFFADFNEDLGEEYQELAAIGPSPPKSQKESEKENIEPPEGKHCNKNERREDKDLKEKYQELAAIGPSPPKSQKESEKENIEPPEGKHRKKNERREHSDVQLAKREKYVTRSSLKGSAASLKVEDDAKEDEDGERMKVRRFGGLHSDDENERVVRATKSEYDPDSIPSPDLITLAQLLNVAERNTKKTYCKENGTSCHQCRQKTLDTKTVCRSGKCVGMRGQFCGPCLRGKYGEEAIVALKDANWACPPCRGLCNCRICRKRNGPIPTGCLAPVVQEGGVSSVKDCLETPKTKKL